MTDMRTIMNIVESEQGKVVTLWHGGRDLQYNYRDFQNHESSRWEHGPGLYLTTHWDTAAKYAKGGRSLYKVTVVLDRNLADVRVSMEEATDFLTRFIPKSKRGAIAEDIANGFARHKDGSLPLEFLLNLGKNYDAIKPSQTGELRKYLVEKGADYAVVKNFGGRPETVVVVINPKIIQNVEKVASKDVKDDELKLPFD